MKHSFLECVAKDILQKFGSDLSHVAVVFPNKRASLFMNMHLVHFSDRPIWSPTYITISDLFRHHSQLHVGDSIKLICDLHKSYNICTGKEETLDTFYGWGQLMLADFDDIDKNMADASKVFSNVKNIHEFDNISYLTDSQKATLQRFFSNFSEDQNTKLKHKFIELWSHFENIYNDYNQRLTQQGIAYEGALYRQVIDNEDIPFEFEHYIFVGFNVLQKVEQKLFSLLKKQGKAMFYWDFDNYYMEDESKEAGHFIRQYLDMFPNELENDDTELYQQFKQTKDISYLSAPTENLQARYITEWLRQNDRMKAGTKTAIVMCDENILQTVIHCIPPEVDKINITTGYPLAQSPIVSLVSQLIRLQTSGHIFNTSKYRLQYVKRILRHPYMMYVSSKVDKLMSSLKNNRQYFPTREMMSIDEGLTLVFKDVEGDTTNLHITQWLLSIIQRIGKSGSNSDDAFFHESVFRMYTLLNRVAGLIESGDLLANITTYERLITQLIQSTSIPFHGEPAEGIQIMGVLETRNLDFDHILVLSCNEGNMPKGVNNSSFIPYSIREAYGLTTIQHKVAIYAYYFHRLLQRATDITLTYNNAPDGMSTGEMSRFMLQMLVESGQHIQRFSMLSGQTTKAYKTSEISKSNDVMKILYDMDEISPTAINRYLRCQLQFYYNMIAGLKEPEAEEDMDNRMFGNIFHRSAELIYTHLGSEQKTITATEIDSFMKEKGNIKKIVDQAFNEEVFKLKDEKTAPEYNGLQLINKEVIIKYLNKLLHIDEKLTPFSIKALEKKVNTNITFETTQGAQTLKIGGYIDRLDEITDAAGMHRIRVVDYKTGEPADAHPKDVKDIFIQENLAKQHKDYYLQTFLYATIVSNHKELNKNTFPVSPALLFIQQSANASFDPTLLLSKDKITDIAKYTSDFMNNLKQVLADIYNEELSFKPTDDTSRCTYCPYKKLCGR